MTEEKRDQLARPKGGKGRAGFLHHRPGDRAILLGEGLAHALHGDVDQVVRICAQATQNHNGGAQEKSQCVHFRERDKGSDRLVSLTATPNGRHHIKVDVEAVELDT